MSSMIQLRDTLCDLLNEEKAKARKLVWQTCASRSTLRESADFTNLSRTGIQWLYGTVLPVVRVFHPLSR